MAAASGSMVATAGNWKKVFVVNPSDIRPSDEDDFFAGTRQNMKASSSTSQTEVLLEMSPEEEDARRAKMLRGFLWNALIDGLGSYLFYSILRRHDTEFHALAWSMLPPALNNLASLVRKRHLDIFGILVIAGLVAGLGLVLLGGSPRLLLVRDSLITGAIGLVFLGSLLLKRPLLFYITQQFSAGTDLALKAEWNARYEESPSHLGLPLITGVWGIVLVAEAGLRTVIALTIPIPVFMAVWPFINLGMYAATSLWTFLYGRRLQDQEDSPSKA